MNNIWLKPDKNDVLIQLAKKIAGYNGTKFQVDVINTSTYKLQPSYWSGGSRTTSYLLRLDDLEAVSLPNFHPMFDGQVIPEVIDWRPGFIVIEHDIFCGTDMGITFVVHADDMKTFALPTSSDDLSLLEKAVIELTCGLKSSYRLEEAERYWKISAAEYKETQELLKSKGLLNKAGAITVDGKNKRTWHTYTLQKEVLAR